MDDQIKEIFIDYYTDESIETDEAVNKIIKIIEAAKQEVAKEILDDLESYCDNCIAQDPGDTTAVLDEKIPLLRKKYLGEN